MAEILIHLLIFTTKAIIIVALIIVLVGSILALAAKSKDKTKGHFCIKNLNKKYKETKKLFLEEISTKERFKKFIKDQKIAAKKTKHSEDDPKSNIFVLNFCGDIKASAVSSLREEVTAILNIATPNDEVVVNIESGGGMVHAYGLATAQLLRIRDNGIPLIVTIDKVAASGGYLMASVANKIIAAPFAIIGSIGVIVQLPNFHRLLKENKVDFEQMTAGEFKRTLTIFGENTEEGREKLREEIETVHQIFKNVIQTHRPTVDIQKVATGEHWLGSQALELKLIDEINTSDEYLYQRSQTANIYEIHYEVKKSFTTKLLGGARSVFENQVMFR